MFSKNVLDSLLYELEIAKEDTNKVLLLNKIYNHYKNKEPKTALNYATNSLLLSEKINYKKGVAVSSYNIGRTNSDIGDYKKALENLNQSLLVFKELNFRLGIASVYNVLGNVHKDLGNYVQALFYYTECKKIEKLREDNEGIGIALSNIGNVYISQGKYEKALESFFESLKIAEQFGNRNLMANTYNNIGIVYYYLNNNEKELEYYNKSLLIKEQLGDKLGIANTTYNIGETLFNLGDYAKALEYFDRSVKLKYQLNDQDGIFYIYSFYGTILKSEKKFNEALKHYFKCISIAKKLNKKDGLPHVYNNIGEIYLEVGQFVKSKDYFLLGLKIATELNSNQDIMDLHKNLSSVYVKLDDFQKALENHQYYVNVKDSIFTEYSSKKIAEMQAKYETEKKEQEIELLIKEQKVKDLQLSKSKIEITNQKNLRNSSVVVFTTLILILVLLFNRFKINQRKARLELEKQQAETENRLLRSQMNPHFIYNSLYSIQGFVANNDSKNAQAYLVDFASLMRAILNNSSQSFITLEKELESLRLYMKLEQLRFDSKFSFEFKIDDTIDEEFILIPPMLIQPFIENSIIHGIMPKSGYGNILINLKEQENSLFCSIIDDGVGRAESNKQKDALFKKHKSIGMEVTRNRLQLLGEEMKIATYMEVIDLKDNYNKPIGTRVDMIIPIKDV